MHTEKTGRCSVDSLHRELAGSRVTPSRFFPGLSLDGLLTEVTACIVIKKNDRRQIFYLQTPTNGFFLKRSILLRSKDRLRHFILPWRKWAEWNNLHRLAMAQVPAARPVLKGIKPDSHPREFFLLTEEIRGKSVELKVVGDAERIGEYAARLHSHGVYHADLNRNNIILTPAGGLFMVDVQEVFFLPWIPRRLRRYNLGKILFNLHLADAPEQWAAEFLNAYNRKTRCDLSAEEVIQAARHHQRRHYRSRSKRCCKNSTHFEIVKQPALRGYKRRDFSWGAEELQLAEEKGQPLKAAHVFAFKGVCIKKQPRKFFHRDRCLASWKMSRALEVRGIWVPAALGYFVMEVASYFISELIADSLRLNDYLSSIGDERTKRRALKKLALWLRKFYDTDVWQRDFKSSNILCRNEEYVMVDLDGVRIRRASEHHKIINLAQLNASLSNAVTMKDRLRFYHYFAADHRPSRQQRRAVYRKVWDISRTKNTAIYDLDLDKLWSRSP